MPVNRLMRSLAGPAALLWGLSAVGCASGSKEFSGPLPSPDGEQFVKEVYPLLLRDCAYVGCHGKAERFFQVYGPGRVRIPPEEMSASTRAKLVSGDPANLDEITRAYERALSMIATSSVLEDCLLLRKPLEAQAGGQGHKGVDDLGRNVFASKSDPGWKLLFGWAKSKGRPPTQGQVDAINEAAASGALDQGSNP